MTDAYTEADILALIHATWGSVPSQGRGTRYLVAEHVNDGAGFGYGRTLDAVVFDTWPSTGLVLHGIEVKITTADFRRELQNPDKAKAFTEHLDMFSIAAPIGVVDLELLPAKWGLYCPHMKGGLRARRKPLYLHEPDVDRSTADRSFMAAFCRALQTRSLSAKVLEEARHDAVERTTKLLSEGVEREREEKERLTAGIAAYQQASGIDIGADCLYGNYPANIGAAVRAILDGASGHRVQQLRRHASDLATIADALEATGAEQSP